MLLNEAGERFGETVDAHRGAVDVLQAGINSGRSSLTDNFRIAGLDTSALPQGPDADRIRQTLASGLGGLDQRGIAAAESGVSGVRQAGEAYRDDARKIGQQLTRVGKDQGLYASQLFEQAVGADRDARRATRAAEQKLRFDAEQGALDRGTSVDTALIGAGLDPVTRRPLPPRAKEGDSKPKPFKRLTPGQMTKAANDWQRALGLARGMIQPGEALTPEVRQEIAEALTEGRPDAPVYDPKTGKRKIDPKTGQQVVAKGDKPVPPHLADAVLDQMFTGYLRPETVKLLHRLGIEIRALPGAKTRGSVKPHKLPNRPGKRQRRDQPG